MDGRGTSAALRRALLAADAVTGEVTSAGAVRDALVAGGLAAPHGARGAVYLTAEGRRARQTGTSAGAPEPGPPREPSTGSGFVPATGDGTDPPPGPGRAAEVATAWRSLIAVRELTGSGAIPAAWERHPGRLVRAVGLALESAGLPPTAPGRAGYHVTPSPDPGAVEVRWAGPVAPREAGAQLAHCADALASRGWDSLTYIGPRRIPYLVVTPRT